MKKNNLKKYYPLVFSLVFCLIISGFYIQIWADTGPRPGSGNPLTVTKRVLFQDDELLLMVGDPTAHKMSYLDMVPDNNQLDSWTSSSDSHDYLASEYSIDDKGYPYPAIKSCRVHFTRNDIEQVAYLLPQADAAHIILELWDLKDGRHTRMTTFPAQQLYYRPDIFDIAAADLDEVTDNAGNYHDEIIIARYNNGKTIINILRHDFAPISTIELVAPSPGGQTLNSLAISAGDFNGDGHLEIVVGQAVGQYSHNGLTATIIHFDHKDGGLTAQVGPTWQDGAQDGSLMDIATGDFNGDGHDDIALATAFYLRLITVDDNWNLQRKILSQIDNGCNVEAVKIASGLFTFDPSNGFDLNRRQLVLCHSACTKDIKCRIWVFDENLKFQSALAWPDIETEDQEENSDTTPHIDLAVGNFIGHGKDGKSTSPLEQVAVSYNYFSEEGYNCGNYSNKCTTYVNQQVTLIGIDGDLTKTATIWQGEKQEIDRHTPPTPINIIALDNDGDSYILGNPAHISISDYCSLDYLIQEPPKHIDYLPVTSGVFDGKWEIANISVYEDFYTELKDDQSTTVTTTAKDTSNWSIGGSASVDVKDTVSENAVLESAETSVEVKAKLSYQYDSSEESWKSQYKSRDISFDGQAVWDDFLIGTTKQLDIWRYPIIGYRNPDASQPPFSYMEIILPGPYTKISGSGKSVVWYQPIHQNGNLLSYPLISDDFPRDLGSFRLPDGSTVQDTMNERISYNYGGVAQDLSLSWTEKAGSGSEKSYNNTLGESLDINLGLKGKAGVLVSGAVDVDVDVNLNHTNSWGGAATSSCVTSESKGITVAVPAGGSEGGYSFMPAVYVSSGTGTLKVAYAVNPIGSASGELWWRNQYGSRPDPALNLPNRFKWHEMDSEHTMGYWTFSKKIDRMEMRGFFLRHNEPDKISGNYELISGPPLDGEIIRLCARIYNFALNDSVDDVGVRFESIQLDDKGKEKGERVVVGETTVSLGHIDDGLDDSMKEAWVAWDTTGKHNKGGSGYRFYVTVDPENKIKNELHELGAIAVDIKDEDAVDFDAAGNPIKPIHGNNEGFWPWGHGFQVSSASATNLQGVASSEEWLAISALQIEKDGKPLSGDKIDVTAGKEYLIRAKVSASSHQTRFVNVFFYEETFSEKRLLAIKRITVMADGSSTWFRWTPKELGVSTISADLVGMDNGAMGPETDLEVAVHPAQPASSWQHSIFDELLQ